MCQKSKPVCHDVLNHFPSLLCVCECEVLLHTPHLAAHLLCLCSSALLHSIYLQNVYQFHMHQYASLTCGVCSPSRFPSKLTAVYRTRASAAINCRSATEINWAMWFVHQLGIWLGFYERPFAWTTNRALNIPRANELGNEGEKKQKLQKKPALAAKGPGRGPDKTENHQHGLQYFDNAN